MQIPSKPISLMGGLDMMSTPLALFPGKLIAAKNYEPHPKGYRRIDGFERFDGQPKPSLASYWVLDFDAGSAAITTGQTVTGATSGATGKALINAVVSTGSYGGGNAAGYLVLTGISGTFQDNEALQVAAVTKSTANGTADERAADTSDNDTTWRELAIETARALIAKPAGSGQIRGVWVYNGATYCFRNNAGGTACVMFKSTTAGWVAQSLGSYVKFTTGTGEITAGQTVTGASSGATGVVTRVVKRIGTWGSTAAGRLIFATITGTFTNGENLQVGGVTKAVASGGSAAITLPANGTYRFQNYNFSGSTTTKRMYGVNGVGTAFEWDGTVFVPIDTGMTTDTPIHILAHKKHLFLAFAKGSLQHSSIGDPYAFDPVTGAEEIGIGEEITGLVGPYSGAMIVFGRNTVGVLYGSDEDTFQLEELSTDSGAIENSAQIISQPIYVDDIGLRKLSTTQQYGDFNLATISELVRPIFEKKKKDGVTIVASLRDKPKALYRVFFSDNTGLSFYFGRKAPEVIPFDLGKLVTACCASEDSSGNAIKFFGSDDGYVYQLDAGTSFDGEEVEAFVRFAYCNLGTPTQNKAWHSAILELDCQPSIPLYISAEYGYGDPDQPPTPEGLFDVIGGGGVWNVSLWDQFYWSAPEVGKARADLGGLGTNCSVAVMSTHTYEEPHIVHGLVLNSSPRGLLR